MNVYRKAALPPQELRRQYLMSLPEAQEWFLEERVRAGETWERPDEGYAVLHNGELVEFYITEGGDALSALADLKRLRPFTTALCKSFDHGLLTASRSLGATIFEVGYLFRTRNKVPLVKPQGFRLIPATPSNLDEAVELGGAFFSSRAEVEMLLQFGGLWMAQSLARVVGCGVTYPLGGPFNAVDIGMVVHPDQRNQGFGSAIVAALTDKVDDAGRRPICGCARDNLASRAALTRAGFVAEHRLLRIEFVA